MTMSDEETASTNTMLVVLAKDGTMRDVAVCATSTTHEIGRDVIDAIHGRRLFQLSTVRCGRCQGYVDDVEYDPATMCSNTDCPRRHLIASIPCHSCRYKQAKARIASLESSLSETRAELAREQDARGVWELAAEEAREHLAGWPHDVKVMADRLAELERERAALIQSCKTGDEVIERLMGERDEAIADMAALEETDDERCRVLTAKVARLEAALREIATSWRQDATSDDAYDRGRARGFGDAADVARAALAETETGNEEKKT